MLHCSRPGHVSFDEQSHKLTTLSLESFGRLGVEGSNVIDQLATRVLEASDSGSMTRKGPVKERLI